jgi:hypothetical protein
LVESKLCLSLSCNFQKMLLLLLPKMWNLYDVYDILYSDGSILHGYPKAKEKLNKLKSHPYKIGVKELGKQGKFISVLDELFLKIELEMTTYSTNLDKLLLQRLSSFGENETVASLVVGGLSQLVRGARLINVIDNIHHYTLSKSKSNDQSYEMLRIYWTSDKGKKVRGLNKNIGNSSVSQKKLAEKVLQLLGYTDIAGASRPYEADLVAKMGAKYFEFDLKAQSRADLIEMFSLLYLWKLYKEIYP